MDHFTFQKMADSVVQWQTRIKKKERFCVMEKVHGANFCISTWPNSDRPVKVSKRKSFLEADDDFFGYQEAMDRLCLADKVRALAQLIAPPPLLRVSVYGELCGGYYGTEGGDPSAAVQSEILYSPQIQFVAFDVLVTDRSGSSRFLDYSMCLQLFEKVAIDHCEPLKIGTLQECLQYPLDFPSTIPAKFGLEPLPNIPNIAEGVVVKSMRELQIETRKGSTRAIVKKKNEKFAERVAIAGATQGRELSVLRGYINDNRLAAVLSKLGRLKDQDKDALVSQLVDDAIADAYADSTLCLYLAKQGEKTARQEMARAAASLVNK